MFSARTCDFSRVQRNEPPPESLRPLFLAKAGASRLVFSSSAFAQGWSHRPSDFAPAHLPLTELSPTTPHESYGLSKLLGETAAAAVARTSARTSKPITFASLRFTNLVYPDAEHTLPWAAPSEEHPANVLMWCWTKAGDVANAHVAALEAESVGPQPHEPFLLSAPTTRFVEHSADLAAKWYPVRNEEAREANFDNCLMTHFSQTFPLFFRGCG